MQKDLRMQLNVNKTWHSQQRSERCIQSHGLQPREQGDVRELLWKTATVTDGYSTFCRATSERTTLYSKINDDYWCVWRRHKNNTVRCLPLTSNKPTNAYANNLYTQVKTAYKCIQVGIKLIRQRSRDLSSRSGVSAPLLTCYVCHSRQLQYKGSRWWFTHSSYSNWHTQSSQTSCSLCG